MDFLAQSGQISVREWDGTARGLASIPFISFKSAGPFRGVIIFSGSGCTNFGLSSSTPEDGFKGPRKKGFMSGSVAEWESRNWGPSKQQWMMRREAQISVCSEGFVGDISIQYFPGADAT